MRGFGSSPALAMCHPSPVTLSQGLALSNMSWKFLLPPLSFPHHTSTHNVDLLIFFEDLKLFQFYLLDRGHMMVSKILK